MLEIYVAAIPFARREEGLEWLMLEDATKGRDSPIANLYALGPKTVKFFEDRESAAIRRSSLDNTIGPKRLDFPGERRNGPIQRRSLNEVLSMAQEGWGVAPADWVLVPNDVALHGGPCPTDQILVEAADSAGLPWRPLKEPEYGGHCKICIHSVKDGDLIPTTHEYDSPTKPTSGRTARLWAACHAQFIERDGLSELMEKLLNRR